MKGFNRSAQLQRAIALFVTLTVLGIGMVVGAGLGASQPAQGIFMHIGAALFSGSLAFFLIEASRWSSKP
jgi:uncharacterized membrane protein YgdD (TMEM256/DUF423 family)